jgi:hypothetical protein
MNNDLNTYKKLFYNYITKNNLLFDSKVSETERNSDFRTYRIELQIPDAHKDQSLSEKIEILFEINFAQLFSAYQKMIAPKDQIKIEYNLSTDEGSLLFFQRKWHQIITHLRAFNQDKDDYDEIAKLAHRGRGYISGRKFGL